MARQKPTYRPKIGFSRFSNTLGFCVLGLIQSSTVLYLGSYKVVGEVVEFNWWRTENQRFRKLENLISVPEIPVPKYYFSFNTKNTGTFYSCVTN